MGARAAAASLGGLQLRRACALTPDLYLASKDAARGHHCLFVLMMSAVFIPACRSPAVSIAVVSVATFGYSGALANLLSLPADVFEPEVVASVWGFASVGSGFGGMLFALVTGWIVQRHSFSPAFVLFGLLPALAGILVWFLPTESGISPVHPADVIC